VKVGFFCQTPGMHLDMAKHLIISVRKTMPGVEIVHLTNGECPGASGVDSVLRIPGNVPMAIRRMRHHASLEGDWLLIDTDCVILKDVRHVFDDAFDIAVTDRKGSKWDGTWYSELMPFNMGVTFSRSPQFWKAVLSELEKAPPKFQQWEGDQLMVGKLWKDWNTKILPGRIYNFTPEKREDSREHAAILHFKGSRKEWVND